MWEKRLDTNRRSRSWRLGPVAVLLSIVTLLSVVAPYGIAGAGPVGIASAAEPTPVPADGNITAPGHYVIEEGFSGPITITANDIVLDGQGHTLSGTILSDGVSVHDSTTTLTNVTVRNLTLSGWSSGIRYKRVDGGTVANVTVRDSLAGVHLVSDSGDWGAGNEQVTRNVTVRDSNVSNNNIGVFVTYSDDNVIANNVANGNAMRGIYLDSTGDNLVSNNTATGNDEDGIRLEDASRTTVANNNASGNEFDGIFLGASYDNTIVDNVIRANADGLHLGNSGNNEISGNMIASNDAVGLSVFNSGSNTVYDNYLANENNTRFSPPVLSNTWNVTTTPGTNVVGGPALGGNYWASPANNGFSQTCADADDDGICDSPYELEGTGDTDDLPLADPPEGVASVAYSNLGISPTTVSVGESVTVTATVTNVGDVGGTYSADLFVGGIVKDSASGSLDKGDGETVTFSVSFDEPGTYAVTVGDLPAESVVVDDGPSFAMSPTEFDFGNVTVGANLTEDVVVENVGTADLNVTVIPTIAYDGCAFFCSGFTVTDGGTQVTLAPGETHTVTVAFEPETNTSYSGTLSISHDGPSWSPVEVPVVGNGTYAPSPRVVPHSVDFGEHPNGSSTTEYVTVENVADVDLVVTGTTLDGPNASAFSIDGGGSFVLAPGEKRTLTATFSPTTTGTKTADLAIASDDTDGPEVRVELTGTGVARERIIELSPRVFEFPDTLTGDTVSRDFTVTNTGNVDTKIRGYDFTGDTASASYVVPDELDGHGESAVLAPGESYNATLTFEPSTPGHARFVLHVNHNGTGDNSVIGKGTGVARDRIVEITPRNIEFPDTLTGDTVTRGFTVANTGNGDVEIRGYDFTGDTASASYVVPDELDGHGESAVLAPGESYNATLTFEPSTPGHARFVLHVNHNGTGDNSVIGKGTGVARDRTLEITPHRIEFPDTLVGKTVSRDFTVTNIGNGNVEIRSYDITGDFAMASFDVPHDVSEIGDEFLLAPGESFNGTLTFEPPTPGQARFVLHVGHMGTGDNSVIGTGTGVTPPGAGSGTGGGTSDDGATDEGVTDGGVAETTVSVTGDSRWTNVSVERADPDEPVPITLDDGNGADGDARLLGMNVTSDGGSFTLNATAEDEPTENVSEFRVSDGGEALGFLRIDHSIPDENISSVTLEFYVSGTRLAERGIAPEDVSLFRYHDGEWNELPTRVVRAEDGGFVLRADSPGLSTFAVAVSPAAIGAVEGDSDAIGSDDESDDSSGAVGSDVSMDSGGATPTAAPEPTTTVGPGLHGFGPVVALVAILVTIVLGRRRRR